MTRRGVQWLSAVADDPEVCRAHWADDPRRPYTLRTGHLFDVVAVGQRLGMEIFDQLERRGMPHGPVMVDHCSRQLGFFLPTRSRDRFARLVAREAETPPEYRYLDEGSFIVVPGPMPLAGDRYQWLHAPVRRPEASPLRTAALAVMLVAVSLLIERADRYGERYPTPQSVWRDERKPVVDHAE
ncbi:bifunctional DNA primase/polymerase [Streptantibioticus parmotrematis]|uniref:bifunctional DNA primase/polymerase n=1 Tax=Streptantibioticus parmotrematis TaxID=2873249 RepID=UPI0033C4C326